MCCCLLFFLSIFFGANVCPFVVSFSPAIRSYGGIANTANSQTATIPLLSGLFFMVSMIIYSIVFSIVVLSFQNRPDRNGRKLRWLLGFSTECIVEKGRLVSKAFLIVDSGTMRTDEASPFSPYRYIFTN